MQVDAPAEDEGSIVVRAVGGDRDAFRKLYECHVDAVFGFVRNRVGPQLADDLTAETFCRAFERIDRYEWRGVPFRAWLLRIAYNVIVGRARKRSSAEVLQGDPTPPPVEGPEDEIVRGSQTSALLAGLRQLAPLHQTVIELRYLQDLSVSETAAVLDNSDEAVRALTYRALKHLRRAMLEGGRP